jgi:hypothetical protein
VLVGRTPAILLVPQAARTTIATPHHQREHDVGEDQDQIGDPLRVHSLTPQPAQAGMGRNRA